MPAHDHINGLILDWAGTAVDHGSRAPVAVFPEIFARRGVTVTLAQAREPMGTHKREHIRRMCAMPEVRAAWQAVHGAPPTVQDEEALYADAVPLQIQVLPDHSTPIAGVVEALDQLRQQGIKVGSTTGYVRSMLDVVAQHAAAQGYRPDAALASDEVAQGRPAPYLAWRAAEAIGAWPHWCCAKVGDTTVDMEAGRNAGFWCIGVTLTGSLVGLSAEELAARSDDERDALHRDAADTLRRAGAHIVLRSAAQLPTAVAELNERLSRGDRP